MEGRAFGSDATTTRAAFTLPPSIIDNVTSEENDTKIKARLAFLSGSGFTTSGPPIDIGQNKNVLTETRKAQLEIGNGLAPTNKSGNTQIRGLEPMCGSVHLCLEQDVCSFILNPQKGQYKTMMQLYDNRVWPPRILSNIYSGDTPHETAETTSELTKKAIDIVDKFNNYPTVLDINALRLDFENADDLVSAGILPEQVTPNRPIARQVLEYAVTQLGRSIKYLDKSSESHYFKSTGLQKSLLSLQVKYKKAVEIYETCLS